MAVSYDMSSGKIRKRRKRNIFTASIILVILILFTVLEYTWLEKSSPAILALLNFNAILLILLVFLIFRNLIKLYIEYSQHQSGSRFRTKLVIAVVSLTLIPTALLAIIGTNLMSNAIKNWFEPQIGQFVDDAMDIARLSHKQFEQYAQMIAEHGAEYLSENVFFDNSKPDSEFEQLLKLYSVDIIQVFSADGTEIVRSSSETYPSGIFLTNPEEQFENIPAKEIPVEILPLGSSEIVRATKPVQNKGKTLGYISVCIRISGPLSTRIRSIQSNYEKYQQQRQYIRPTQGLYISIFLIISLTVLFAALWIALYFARQISEPITHLSDATRALAAGNYDYHLDIQALDELGDLVRSFNTMTEELKTSRNLIERTTGKLQEQNKEIETRRHELEVILSTIKAGVVALDSDGIVRVINSSACSFLNLSASAITNLLYADAFKKENLHPVVDILDRMYIDKYKVFQNEIQIETGNRLSTFSINVTPLYSGPGSFNGVVMVLNDLTHLLRMQRIAAWREVARRLAHEIKNPLTPIQLNTQRLQRKFQQGSDDFSDVFKTATDGIINEVQGLRKLLDEFSQFARLPEATLRTGKINDIISQAADLYAGKQDIKILLQLDRSLPEILFDSALMKRIFINLIDNAIESMNGTGQITIKTHYDNTSSRVILEVCDEGRGVPDRDKNKLFLPYFSTKKRGSGLGLAICSRIITDHEGSIRVTDNEPRGARFIIELPGNMPG